MSRLFTNVRRLLTTCTLAGAIAAIVAAQTLAAVPSGIGPDTDAWVPYAVSYTQSQQAATPVSDVSNSLHVARLGGSSSGSILRSARPREASATVTMSNNGSFDWASAGIGAGGAVMLVLLTLAGGLALRRRGRLAI
jgi:hypothetical protein